jgi:hypothetical protein
MSRIATWETNDFTKVLLLEAPIVLFFRTIPWIMSHHLAFIDLHLTDISLVGVVAFPLLLLGLFSR